MIDMKNKASAKTIGLTTSSALLVSNTLFKSIDPRVRSIVALSSGFLLSVFSRGNPVSLGIGFGLMISGSVDAANSMRGGAIRSNKFNGIIYCKNENSPNVIKLRPFETIGLIKKIDGVATPFRPNYVYKIPDSCLVDILENGDIKLSYGFSRVINRNLLEKAGWRDADWVRKNKNWAPLLECVNH